MERQWVALEVEATWVSQPNSAWANSRSREFGLQPRHQQRWNVARDRGARVGPVEFPEIDYAQPAEAFRYSGDLAPKEGSSLRR